MSFKKSVSRAWERAPFSQRRYSFWYDCSSLEFQWQMAFELKSRTCLVSADCHREGCKWSDPGCLLSWAGLGFDWLWSIHNGCWLIPLSVGNKGLITKEAGWITSCQSLHSSSKFGCFRKTNLCDCFLQTKKLYPQPLLPGRRLHLWMQALPHHVSSFLSLRLFSHLRIWS